MPESIPLRTRRDDTIAARSLERAGRLEPQPVPPPRPATNPFLEPDWPPDDEPA
jgi:hypothetical protein